MGLKTGLVGIANSGKTTLFNCLTNSNIETSAYAFSNTKSNIGIASVRDPRLDEIHKLIPADKKIYATIEIVDIPGLVKGASQGEGIGNTFLNDIRNMDALVYVLRCFEDESLSHIEGSIDPVRDKEILDLELQVKDLEQVDRKLQKVEKLVKSGDKTAVDFLNSLLKFKDALENFINIRDLELNDTDKTLIKELAILTAKPVFYVLNVDENSVNGNKYTENFLKSISENTLIVAAKIEEDIMTIDNEDERKEFLAEYGLDEPAINKLSRGIYKLLNLITFFTIGGKENKAWSIKNGATAVEAAEEIHSDLARGFIKAEVISYEDLINYKSEQACRNAGKIRLEGKNYIVKDGDILHIRFNV
jgi:GTP-binding protein YchF